MRGLKDFVISFSGLSDGSHVFSAEVDDTFFEAFPESEIRKGNALVKIDLLKRANMLTLDLSVEGEFSVQCDRCGNDYRQPLKGAWQLIVNTNADAFNDEDDLISLPAVAHQFDLSKNVYEYVTLLLPARRICGDPPDPSKGDCDPEIIAQIEKLKPDGSDDDKSIDPRWDALKNLKL
ncbi:MAG TPA: DUF177 domain-containing protein [Bacteroidia bacterium]|nr:DUF177 domain-containing protein [Bacteroidia bacterium]